MIPQIAPVRFDILNAKNVNDAFDLWNRQITAYVLHVLGRFLAPIKDPGAMTVEMFLKDLASILRRSDCQEQIRISYHAAQRLVLRRSVLLSAPLPIFIQLVRSEFSAVSYLVNE